MSEPIAWMVESPGVEPLLTQDRRTAEVFALIELRVTPLIAAPPEGAPSYAELVDAVRKYGRHARSCETRRVNVNDPDLCDCGLPRMLSRLPQQEGTDR